jgi:hypothetical protein
MFNRCIFCHATFHANESIERFQVGRRIAFDPGRGRLWAICDACRRWNLAPIEERWEALEDLEKLVTDRGRLLSQTDNIALIRAAYIDVVRVGHAKLNEEAWWRYGRELKSRRSRYTMFNVAEAGLMVAVGLATGGMALFMGGDVVNSIARWRRYGSTAWRGAATCTDCGHILDELPVSRTKHLFVVPGAEDDLVLRLKCRRCKRADASSGYLFDGLPAQHLLRRTLAWHHNAGATEKRVLEATRLIDEAGSSSLLARRTADRRLPLHKLDRKKNLTESIALEIAINDDVERQLLELELEALEERWREEEELAAIIDGELTPLPQASLLFTAGGAEHAEDGRG